jgi:hypothetical protein
MPDCECLQKCPFFNDMMANMPAMSELIKVKYCKTNCSGCARYMVFKALGRGNVPPDLHPVNLEDAKKSSPIPLKKEPFDLLEYQLMIEELDDLKIVSLPNKFHDGLGGFKAVTRVIVIKGDDTPCLQPSPCPIQSLFGGLVVVHIQKHK